MKIVDLTGMTFSRLTVEMRDGHLGIHPAWICRCICGQMARVSSTALKSGQTQSCGCLQRERTSKANRRHGRYGTRTYWCWAGMFQRAGKVKNYEHVTVCDRWRKFENFLEDMGECPPDMSIDRVDNDKGYEPNNCRWATRLQQQRNRRYCRHLTKDGVTMTAAEWAKKLGVPKSTFMRHLDQGKLLLFVSS
jgi:hypothetical protein